MRAGCVSTVCAMLFVVGCGEIGPTDSLGEPAVGDVVQYGGGGPDGGITSYEFVDDVPFEWTDISTTGIELRVADDGAETIELPFEFEFYGVPRTTISVASNGVVAFSETDKFQATNLSLPADVADATSFIAVHWDDILPLLTSSIRYQIDGEEPSRSLTIQWNDVVHFGAPGIDPNASFGIVLFERTNLILLQYESLAFGGTFVDGGSATVGVQGSPGLGQTYSFNSATLSDGLAVLVQIEGCGEDTVCNDTCTFDPDCPLCIADENCNAACTTTPDPDCPVCIMDDMCNEACGDDTPDPDCVTTEPTCIADGMCDEACETDPDCEICESNGVCNPACDVDPDCDGGCNQSSSTPTEAPVGLVLFGLLMMVGLPQLRRRR